MRYINQCIYLFIIIIIIIIIIITDDGKSLAIISSKCSANWKWIISYKKMLIARSYGAFTKLILNWHAWPVDLSWVCPMVGWIFKLYELR